MKHIFSSLIVVLIFSCTNRNNKRQIVTDFIPHNSTTVVKINSIEGLKSTNNNSELKHNYSELQIAKPLKYASEIIDNLQLDKPVFIALNNSSLIDSLNFTLLTKYHDSLLVQDSTKTIKQGVISTISLNDSNVFASRINSVFVASYNKELVQSVIDNPKINRQFDALNLPSSDTNISLLVTNPNKSIQDTNTIPFKAFGNLTTLNLDISQDEILFDGITTTNDSSYNLINYLKTAQPQPHNLLHLAPSDADIFTSFSVGNLNTLATNFSAVVSDYEELKDGITEIGHFTLDNKDAYAFKSIDTETALQLISETASTLESYRDINIYGFDNDSIITDLFKPFLKIKPVSNYFLLDDFIVFSTSIGTAQHIISSYKNKSTLAASSAFESIKEQISDESSVLHFSTSDSLSSFITNSFPETLQMDLQKLDLKQYNTKVFQLTNDTGFAHVNAIAKKYKKRCCTRYKQHTVSYIEQRKSALEKTIKRSYSRFYRTN